MSIPRIKNWQDELYYFHQALRRFALSMLLFSICRLIFYIVNKNILPTPSVTDFLWGFWFDASAAAYVNALLWLSYFVPLEIRSNKTYQKSQKWLFVVTNFIAIIVEMIDAGFFKFANRRTILSDFSLIKNTMALIPKFLSEYWFLVVAGLLLLLILNILYSKTNLIYTDKNFGLIPQTGIFIVSIGLFIVMARGGVQLRPLTPLSSAEVASDMRLMPLVSNTTLNLIHSTGQRFITEKKYMSDAVVESIYPIYKINNARDSFKKLNVVIIALESFGKEYSKYFNAHIPNYQGYTPFLDSLIQQGLYCENSFANGLRSTQGIVSITAGLPALMDDPYMFSPYQSNRLDGLAAHLKSKGYATAFFHGSNPGSMDFDKFANLTGFNAFFDRYGYGNQADYDGAWGIWDEPMMQFMAQKLNEMPQPFYGFFFSLTSHHPFKVPKWFEEKYANMEPLGRSFLYADYALRQFFETARKMPWFDNTLFVLSADHTGLRSPFEEYQTKIGRYKIPILFYKPNEIKPKVLPKTCQQIDIVPTVLDILKYDKPYLSFGRSILDSTEGYAFQYEENFFQIENNRFVLFFDGEKTTGLFDYKNDILLKNDIKNQLPKERELLEAIIKSVIQQHHKVMIFNKLAPN